MAEIKNAAVAVRTTPRIKRMLEESARANGRSVTKEIESRLELSFAGDMLDFWTIDARRDGAD